MQHFSPKMSFKGNRRYLHGTSILEYAMQVAKEHAPAAYGGRLRAVFHGLACNSLHVALASDDERSLRPEKLTAEVISQGESGERVFLWFTESGKPTSTNVPYPEELLAPQLVYSGQRVMLHGDSPFSPVETLVTMTKFLHLRLMPEVGGWIFTRLDMVHPLSLDDLEGLFVELQSQLGTLSRARVCAASGELGVIYFSATPK